jgi:hypothetical protein
LRALVDLDAGHTIGQIWLGHVDHSNRIACSFEFLSGIKLTEQRLADMKAFGQTLASTRIVKRRQVLQSFEFARHFLDKRPAYVCFTQSVVDHDRSRLSGHKLVPHLFIQVAG